MDSGIHIRKINATDNFALAKVIKDTMTEFGVNLPNTVFDDPTTDHLYELFQKKGAVYNVAEMDGELVGGAGLFPTSGLPDTTCELVKMYLSPKARGQGLGKHLIEKCIEQAKEMGYKNIYLESMPELKKALSVYSQFGFEYLDGPMGNSGHGGCGLWMLKKL
ncbi:MAG: GNAT family N-acetyltransferase [Bacteroidetes bacterium]|nr:GNAT family N-acetyltransferase [Bacteroidota bacterium]MBS1631329.1 GNAT family N-acetyltransferase [Bacteroidota bacterium]